MFFAVDKKGHSSNLFVDFMSLLSSENSNTCKNRFGFYKTEIKETLQM